MIYDIIATTDGKHGAIDSAACLEKAAFLMDWHFASLVDGGCLIAAFELDGGNLMAFTVEREGQLLSYAIVERAGYAAGAEGDITERIDVLALKVAM